VGVVEVPDKMIYKYIITGDPVINEASMQDISRRCSMKEKDM
jgi:hypothetical protein